MLLRLIDDYLFVTTSLSKAREFLDVMKKGSSRWEPVIKSVINLVAKGTLNMDV